MLIRISAAPRRHASGTRIRTRDEVNALDPGDDVGVVRVVHVDCQQKRPLRRLKGLLTTAEHLHATTAAPRARARRERTTTF